MIPFFFINPNEWKRWILIISVNVFITSTSNLCLFLRKINAAVFMLLFPGWILITYLAYTGAGLYTNVIVFYSILIISAGLLLNLFTGSVFTIVTVFTLIGIYFLSNLKMLPPSSLTITDEGKLITLSLFLLSIQSLLIIFVKIIKTALDEKNKENEDRRKAEFALQETNNYLNSVLESANRVSIISIDTEGIIKTYNKGAEILLGYKSEEVINIKSPLVFHSLEEIALRKKEVEILTGKQCSELDALVYYAKKGIMDEREWKHIRKDGRERTVILSISAIYSQGIITGYLGTAIDITESYQSRVIIRALNRELEDKVKHRTKELRDMNHNLLRMNSEMERTMKELSETQSYLIQSEKLAALGQLTAGIGHELNTPLGTIISSTHTLSEVLSECFSNTMKSVRAFSEEEFGILIDLYLQGQEGLEKVGQYSSRKEKIDKKRIVEGQFANLNYESIDCLIEYDIDVFALRNRTHLVNERINDIVQSLNSFLSIQKMNKIISQAGEKSFHVVRSLKSYMNSENDTQSEPIYLSKEFDTILTLNQNRIKFGIEVFKDFKAPEPFIGKRGYLNQVWINLINNAIHAMDTKGILVLRTWIEEEFVFVSIQDDGKGIPYEIKDRIFEPFFTTKKAGDGIGLGLNICRKIIEQLGGKISFRSQPGETEFVVKVPYSIREK